VDSAERGVARSVGVDPEHQRGMPAVAEPGPSDVSAPKGRTRAGDHDAVATAQKERARLPGDGENNRCLARRAARILDLRHLRAWTDRLALSADRGQRAVPWVQADQRRGNERLGEHRWIVRTQSSLRSST
jgi:hypothetical protein